MSASALSSIISRDYQDLEGELDWEYGLIQVITSEVGATHVQVQDNQATNQKFSPCGSVIETTELRFRLEIKIEQQESI